MKGIRGVRGFKSIPSNTPLAWLEISRTLPLRPVSPAISGGYRATTRITHRYANRKAPVAVGCMLDLAV